MLFPRTAVLNLRAAVRPPLRRVPWKSRLFGNVSSKNKLWDYTVIVGSYEWRGAVRWAGDLIALNWITSRYVSPMKQSISLPVGRTSSSRIYCPIDLCFGSTLRSSCASGNPWVRTWYPVFVPGSQFGVCSSMAFDMASSDAIKSDINQSSI